MEQEEKERRASLALIKQYFEDSESLIEIPAASSELGEGILRLIRDEAGKMSWWFIGNESIPADEAFIYSTLEEQWFDLSLLLGLDLESIRAYYGKTLS